MYTHIDSYHRLQDRYNKKLYITDIHLFVKMKIYYIFIKLINLLITLK